MTAFAQIIAQQLEVFTYLNQQVAGIPGYWEYQHHLLHASVELNP